MPPEERSGTGSVTGSISESLRPSAQPPVPPIRKHGYGGGDRDKDRPKDTHRTMGYARVPLNPPTEFLKAHSLSARKLEPDDSVRPQSPKCKLNRRRPPVPKREALLEKERETAKNGKEEKDFRKLNKLEVRQLTPKQPVHRVVDSRDGHIQITDRSGLEPVYLFKKSFGKKPAYIKESKTKVNERRLQEKDASMDEKPTMHIVTDEEREKLLKGLKHNWTEVQREFQLLPMITDTMPKKKHKMRLENQLRELEKDIDLLERNPVIYVRQERDDQLTANSSSKFSGSRI